MPATELSPDELLDELPDPAPEENPTPEPDPEPDPAPPTFLLCKPEHLRDLLLAEYLAACEQQNPGLVQRTIAAVSGEIVNLLQHRYPQPWPLVPELVRYCAAVIAAYRTVQAITTLVKSESGTDNEWIPLQKQWKYCTDMLVDMAAGRVKLPLTELNADREDANFAVISQQTYFDFRGF